MAKVTALSPELMTVSAAPTTPLAPNPTPAGKAAAAPVTKPAPLQIRIPPTEVKAIKRAALEADQTISEFMLSCFHAYMGK